MIKNNTSLVNNVVLFCYLSFLFIRNVADNRVITLVWYIVLFACSALSFFQSRTKYNASVFVFAVIYFITSIFNIIIVGNTSFGAILYTILSICIAVFLKYGRFSTRVISIYFLTVGIIVLLLMVRNGIGNAFFTSLSNNYISVIFLVPVLLYYLKSDERGEPVRLVPAVVFLLLCCFAQGRGGIIVSAFLLMGILIVAGFKKNKIRGWDILMAIAAALVFLTAVILFWDKIMLLFARFQKYGTYGTGRSSIWGEYYEHAMMSVKSLLGGVKFDELTYMIRYKNNLHNSFLMIHAHNGSVMLLYVLLVLGYKMLIMIKNKKWLSLVCLIALCLRGMTDKVFWGNAMAMPMLLYFLFS